MSRYLGITSQLSVGADPITALVIDIMSDLTLDRVDNIIIFSNGRKPVPEDICRKWICFEIAVSLISFGLIELLQVLQGAFAMAAPTKYINNE